MRTKSPIQTPAVAGLPVPERVQVAVLGGGLTGMAIASGLRDQGVHVHLFEAGATLAGGMATRGMGIASTLLLDPPFRLIQAVGLRTASEILKFTAEGVRAWGDELHQTGVIYATKGNTEAEEIPLNLRAMADMGIGARPWSSSVQGLGDGWIVPSDGVLDLQSITSRLAARLPHSTAARAVAIDDADSDLMVRFEDGRHTRADIVVMTGGAQVTRWSEDKFHPVRHQALATEPVDALLAQPMHIQYGYTSVRQQPTGEVFLSGCRWATPHLEMGESDDTVISEAVDTRLSAFLSSHWPALSAAAITHRWTSIMTFTCDGLPVLGPLPGRPRIISCGGFGSYGPSFALRAAQAVTDGIMTGESPGVPECFTTRRFD